MKKIFALFLVLFACYPAFAQQVVYPLPATSTALSGTIAVSNTFQSVLAAGTIGQVGSRKSCLFQNQGTHTMYFFFGTLANATEATSIQVSPGQTISCQSNGVTLQDQVSVTGTSGDTYAGYSQ